MTIMKDDQRQRWQEYNRSERGKARHRRYRERVRFLEEAKSRAGCLECGERDPRALSFVPRPGRKVKFQPGLMHATRSLEDWKEVIRGCDVLCRSCRAKQGRSASRGPEKAQRRPQIPHCSTVNGSTRPDPAYGGYHPTCETCKAEFKPLNGPGSKRRKRFCSDRCRLLHWAARELTKAYQEGRADGLCDVVSELGGRRES